MPHTLPYRLVLALVAWLTLGIGSVLAQNPVTVFAAASLKTALDDVAALYQAQGGGPVQLSYAGSSALARQIQHGAPAHIFLSANTAWMDALDADGLIVDSSRVDLLTNQLILIAAPDSKLSLTPQTGFDLSGALGDNLLALALIDAVPAGIYGRAALQSLGVWNSVRDRVVQTDNVRAGLRLVAVGEAELGIVYATDAIADPDVRVLGAFPPDSHPSILYPAAILRDRQTAESQAFFDFLVGPAAAILFSEHGFGRPRSVND